jgi:hypothetical protein
VIVIVEVGGTEAAGAEGIIEGAGIDGWSGSRRDSNGGGWRHGWVNFGRSGSYDFAPLFGAEDLAHGAILA